VIAEVRDAHAQDVPELQRVASAAWRDTYSGLLASRTIESFIETAYATETILRRIDRDTFLVAVADGIVRAFADAVPRERYVTLGAIYAEPDWRSRGFGSLLLDELRRRFPGLPIAADVLIGNRIGEVFYERRWLRSARGARGRAVRRDRSRTALVARYTTRRAFDRLGWRP